MASLGLDIGPAITTEKALEINLKKGLSGSSWGNIEEPDVLLRGAEKLKKAGATAIANAYVMLRNESLEKFQDILFKVSVSTGWVLILPFVLL